MGLLQEESWQYQAFSSLLAQRDRRITQLNEDIRIVIDQLNQLTNWELDRKRKQMDVTNVRYKLSLKHFCFLFTSNYVECVG